MSLYYITAYFSNGVLLAFAIVSSMTMDQVEGGPLTADTVLKLPDHSQLLLIFFSSSSIAAAAAARNWFTPKLYYCQVEKPIQLSYC